jgi:hypothetical protein
MKHLGEQEFLDLYCGEGAKSVKAHLEVCRECSTQYAKFKKGLALIKPAAASKRSVDYGEQVWKALRPGLTPYREKISPRWAWAQWRAGAVAVACAMLLAVAFFGGRYWERITTKKANLTGNAQATKRVVLVVLTDHLDEAERLLVALEHTESSDKAENAQLQSDARELLASNRLYRDTARNIGDPGVASALDQLEGVLAEVSNGPSLTTADLARVRNEMNIEGILFEIRVLRTRGANQGSVPKPAKGESI